jgi:hypothetical protein
MPRPRLGGLIPYEIIWAREVPRRKISLRAFSAGDNT